MTDIKNEKRNSSIGLAIQNSPYQYISIEVEQGFTLGDLKKLILEKYNAQQTSSHHPVTFSVYGTTLNELDNFDLYDYLKERGRFTYIDAHNSNIDHRMNSAYKNYLQKCTITKPRLSFAHFAYCEFDRTRAKEIGRICFPARRTTGQLAFFHMGTFADKSHLIKFIQRQNLNFGSGPQCPQEYYRLFADGTAGVYYGEMIRHDMEQHQTAYKIKFNSIDSYLMADLYPVHRPCNEIKWNLPPDVCDICNDNVPNLLFLPCQHVRVCDACPIEKLDKCTQCDQKIQDTRQVSHISSL